MKRLITSSLLDSYSFYKTCPPNWKQRAYKSFIDMIKREPSPVTPEIQRGIDFENLICKNCNEKTDDEMVWTAREFYMPIIKASGISSDKDIKFIDTRIGNTVREVAKRCRGGEQQKKLVGDLMVDGEQYTLFGYADIVQPDRIIDIKTCTNFNKSKYTGRAQHLIYSYLTGILVFEYAVADFKKTKYPLGFESVIINCLQNCDFVEDLKMRIREVIMFIKDEKLYDDYLKAFSAKSRAFENNAV